MSAGYSLPRRPARTRQPALGYAPPICFSRFPVVSRSHRVILGCVAQADRAACVQIAYQRRDGQLEERFVVPSEGIEVMESALAAVRDQRSRTIGLIESGDVYLDVYTRTRSTPQIRIQRRQPTGEKVSRPMRISVSELDALEAAIAWLRNETT